MVVRIALTVTGLLLIGLPIFWCIERFSDHKAQRLRQCARYIKHKECAGKLAIPMTFDEWYSYYLVALDNWFFFDGYEAHPFKVWQTVYQNVCPTYREYVDEVYYETVYRPDTITMWSFDRVNYNTGSRERVEKTRKKEVKAYNVVFKTQEDYDKFLKMLEDYINEKKRIEQEKKEREDAEKLRQQHIAFLETMNGHIEELKKQANEEIATAHQTMVEVASRMKEKE